MKYPVEGKISVGSFVVLNEDDLFSMIDWLELKGYDNAAKEVKLQFPEIFPSPTHTVELTQNEIDFLHLVLGHSNSEEAFSVNEKIDSLVSEDLYNEYDRVNYEVCSSMGLNITAKIS